ncbi:hypothetical protein DFJ58DRAFT_704881 [Suillus subalutaceus]|uniref:uncharacterized protein n=1 Tax=Suillus subalutaceus TaxID=48586 RepID=UPI001B871A3F|nr:uncharacterized protein DFJ58DRAFT_704881 [Suillus subalutaceus]KAG1848942.1 hypothetical protein DFJ58DRAFT_704881 [Suillus subalutaceus]
MALLPFTLAAILLLLCIPFVRALPPLNCTSTPTLDVTDSPSSSDTRTLWDIIWSCVATLFACTWTAIHPNIPGMDEGRMTIFFRRLYIMVLALIAPVLMVTWAAIQFLSALEWTAAHGFFAWMGGFMLYCDDEPRATLTPKELMDYIRDGCVDIPDIVEADIEGRSKGDALSKGIAVLQLGWFVLQLVARYIQHLPTTLLEIDTLAIVSLACIAYCLWWKKPKDVRRPYPVHWNRNKTEAPPLRTLTYEYKTKSRILLGCLVSLSYPSHYPLRSLMGTAVTISPCTVRERRAPSLGGYADDNRHDRSHVITLFLGCFSGVIYGGLHCLGWNYPFQWHTEQMLWRVASIVTASASVPFLLIFGWVILSHAPHDSWVVRFAVVAIAFISITTRVTVIVLILLSLRSLPPGIYDTVAWTTFVPHL